eukprot:SAG31_NODE_20032_length_585_cov_1.281893_1_plen_79_part_00
MCIQMMALQQMALLAGLRAATAPPPARPNFLLFLVDDMGYGDLSCFGGSEGEECYCLVFCGTFLVFTGLIEKHGTNRD